MSASEKEKVREPQLAAFSRFSLAVFIHTFLSSWADVANFSSAIQDPAALKEEGNTLFKAGDMQGAVCCYTKALKLSDSPADSAVLYRNRSACYLKLEEYSKAEADASKGATHHCRGYCTVIEITV